MSRFPRALILPSSGIPRNSRTRSNSSHQTLAGVLLHRDSRGDILARRKIFANKEFIVGRDRSKCQFVISDPTISKKHLRVYTVVYDNENPEEVDVLVYAEDLSSNGTYWNGSLIGRGNGGFLLSQDDKLKLASNVFLDFQTPSDLVGTEHFDETQEVEMVKFRQSFILTDRLLGAGAYGRVFMAVEQSARRQLACKVVDLRKLRPSVPIGCLEHPAAAEDVDDRLQMRKVRAWADKQQKGSKLEDKLKVYAREVEILNSISHPNIIGLEKVYVTDNSMYIFQDLVTGGDLFSYIESKNGKLLEVEAAVIIRQILVGLLYLHDKNIVHRDLKPDNILMTSSAAGCRVVLTDFGAARKLIHSRHRMLSLVGTDEYAAPEMNHDKFSSGDKSHSGYTKSVDLWSLGCVTVILLTGGGAFVDPSTGTYSEKLAQACNMSILRNSMDWQRVRARPKSFVEKLLVLNEDERMTASQALRHEWFSNDIHKTNFEDLYQRAIKCWRRRHPLGDIVEFQDASFVRSLMLPRRIAFEVDRRGYGENPIDAHCKPVPKKMWSTFWPRRNKSRHPSEEVLGAMRQWSSQDRNEISFDDDDDDADNDEEKTRGLSHKAGRHDSLRFTQSGIRSFAVRGQRSNSAPSRLAILARPPKPQPQSIGKTRTSPVSFHPAIIGLQGSSITTKHRPIIFTRRSSPLRESRSSKEVNASMNMNSDLPHEDSSMSALSQQSSRTKSTPATLSTPSIPVQTDRLKRWLSTPIQYSDVPRSSSKRRRSSIFDIEEDGDDAEMSPCQQGRSKRNKKVNFVHERDLSEGSEKDAAEDEITLPHRPATFQVSEHLFAGHGLFLPR